MNTHPLRLGLTAAGAALIFAGAAEARAQELKLAAAADVASGLDGGTYAGGVGIRRARTTLRLGVDAHVDETPENSIAASLLLEIEPHAAVGVDVRYQRMFGHRIALDLGLSSLLAPATLFGAVIGATYRIPVAPRVMFTIGPAITGYFLGSDLPTGTIVWQVLVRGGVRVAF